MEDPNYTTACMYHWTLTQESILKESILNGRNNSRILTELKEKGASSAGKWPSLAQVGVKKRNMKKALRKYNITDYNMMREICERNSGVPDDDHEVYIPFFYIDTSDIVDPKFTVIWTTRHMEKKDVKEMSWKS